MFDIDAVGLLRAVKALRAGSDYGGNELNGPPDLFAGAVVNPGALDLDKELARMEDKIAAGAAFFQTQAVYEPSSFEKFMDGARRFSVPVLAGLIVLKSANMARYLNTNLPGVSVPEHIIGDMERAADRSEASIQVSARIIRDTRDMCDGVHIMAIGWESRIPKILEAAGLADGSSS